MSTHASRSAYEKHEARVAELATRPVETARRLLQAEEALRRIESISERAIHEYGITQEKPEKWMQLGELARKIAAPIRDAAREGLKR